MGPLAATHTSGTLADGLSLGTNTPRRYPMAASPYDPSADYPVAESDREYLRHGAEAFLVRIYQPEGHGPFPMLLVVHGGAWNVGSRTGSAHLDRALAAS